MTHPITQIRASLRARLAAMRADGVVLTMDASSPIERLRAQIAGLHERRTAALVRYDEALAAAQTETRDLTPDEGAVIDAATAEITQIDTDLAPLAARLEQIEAVERSRASTPAFIMRGGPTGTDPYDIELRTAPRTQEVLADIRERALRAIELADMPSQRRDAVEELVRSGTDRGGALSRHILATGRPDYRTAFAKVVTQTHPVLTEREARALEEVRALEIGTDASGGYLMPFTLDPTIILTNVGAINPIRDLATVKTVATDNWQGVSTAGVTASYAAESAEVGDGTPTLAQPAVAIHKAHAFVPFSHEAEDDLVGLADDIAVMFGDAKNRLEATKFTLGTGTAQPWGVVTAVAAVAGSRVASAATDTYAVGDVYAIYNALPARWAGKARFMANRATISLTRQFGTAVSHAFLTDLAGGVPPLLLGQPFHENSDMDGVLNAGADNDMLLYGDFSQYRIHDRIGLAVEYIPNLFGSNGRPTGQRGWYARWRNGANVMTADAFRLLRVT